MENNTFLILPSCSSWENACFGSTSILIFILSESQNSRKGHNNDSLLKSLFLFGWRDIVPFPIHLSRVSFAIAVFFWATFSQMLCENHGRNKVWNKWIIKSKRPIKRMSHFKQYWWFWSPWLHVTSSKYLGVLPYDSWTFILETLAVLDRS